MSLTKGLLILESFITASEDGLSLSEIVKATGLNIATTHRICSILEKKRFITRHQETKRYWLGPTILTLGGSLSKFHRLIDIARPYMQKLSQEVQEAVNLSILEDSKAIIVEKVDIDRTIIPRIKIGQRMPLHCSASGKIFLSGMEKKEFDRLLMKLKLNKLTQYTIDSKDKLIRQIEFVRDHGYANNIGEYDEELAAIATPVRNTNEKIIGSICIYTPISRIGSAKLKQFVPKLIETGKLVSKEIGYRN